jgi:hypothetical protein
MASKAKSIRVKRTNGLSCPIIECDGCGNPMSGNGNVYFGSYKKTQKMKWHTPRFMCGACIPKQWQQDQAKGITRASFGLGEFVYYLHYNAGTKSQRRILERAFRQHGY